MIEATSEQLDRVSYNADGLVPVITQDLDGTVLMFAWMNAETLRMTLDEGRMVYWSRSRQEIWRKGDTSGDHQVVHEGSYDCDGDVLLFKVRQIGGGACHTGHYSCFFRRFGEPSESSSERTIGLGEPSESSSERTIRHGEPSESSSERTIRHGEPSESSSERAIGLGEPSESWSERTIRHGEPSESSSERGAD